jgi:hypothetical protein
MANPPRQPVADLTDEDLVAAFRRAKTDLTHDMMARKPGAEGSPAAEIDTEMTRRGLMPDREDVIPDEPNGPQDIEAPR